MDRSELIHWRLAPARPWIDTGDLHLWRIQTDGRGADLETAASLLGEHQRQRVLRMSAGRHRDGYIRAQSGLRLILARYLELDPRSLVFEKGPAGKPFLPSELGAISFNLTTTGDLALVAISGGRGPSAEVGVDCERIRPRRDLQAVAARMLGPAVLQSIAAAPSLCRLGRFYRAWTALEADAKSDGRGLFRRRAPTAGVPLIRHFIPEPGYVGAVARASLPPVEAWAAFE
jgi:4'-phosphopantetheinyl transferase